jgi:hypothetical protein
MRRFAIVLCVLIVLSLLGLNGSHAGWIEDGMPLMRQWGSVGTGAMTTDGSSGAIVVYQACHEGIGRILAQCIDSLGVTQWGAEGVVVCPAGGHQDYPRIATDGAGGAIIIWCDYRNGDADIYAQRVDASGAIQWASDGVPLCLASADQIEPQVIPDGAGGAIVAWQDYRGGTTSDVYAQRVNAAGAVQWTASGVALCTATGNQYYPVIASDGAGGAIAAWTDVRSGDYDIYAQRVDASGGPGWAASGVVVCSASGSQQLPQIASDGAGGALVTWQDYRGSSYDIYAQRVNAAGAVQWTANGVAFCTASYSQQYPQIISDGAGGAIVTWQDERSSPRVYAQRANAFGTILWTADGVALSNPTASQYSPAIVSDGAGGAIVAWHGYGLGSSMDFGIYAQRVDASGAALWSLNAVPVCTATGNQITPAIISDGAGGAIVEWQDNRVGNSEIYAQRVNGAGTVRWTANGVALTAAIGLQQYPRIVSDGASGAIITWQDNRTGDFGVYAQRLDASGDIRWGTGGAVLAGSGGYPVIAPDGAGGAIVTFVANLDIYAQRVNASGAVQWAANGVALCTASYTQQEPQITSDGAGGAIVVWLDGRNGNLDIYAQRVNASGAIQWTTNGVAICTALDEQRYFQIISDGSGGAIVAWSDLRSASTYDVYVQRVDASGAVQWTTDGVAICTAAGSQFYPAITSDGAGGAIVAWADYRSGTADIYAQRVDVSGAVQWTGDGVGICTATRNQYNPAITTDGSGGAIVTWWDSRINGNNNIYAQRVDASGAVPWDADGVAICTASNTQEIPQITSDGSGGAIIAWQDYRNGSYDIYAQRVNALGVVLWAPDGNALCTARSAQQSPQIATDGEGGAIVIWTDTRCGSWTYAQRMRGSGAIVSTLLQTHAAVPAASGIRLDWSLSELGAGARFSISRSSAPDWVYAELADAVIKRTGLSFVFIDDSCLPGSTYKYRVEYEAEGSARMILFETDGIAMPPLPVTLYQNHPNPFNPRTVIRFYLPDAREISLDVYNAAGEHVVRLAEGKRAQGHHEVSWDGRNASGELCASGVYFSRLIAGKVEASRKMLLLR